MKQRNLLASSSGVCFALAVVALFWLERQRLLTSDVLATGIHPALTVVAVSIALSGWQSRILAGRG